MAIRMAVDRTPSALPGIEVWPLPQPWRDQIESTWDRVFDRERHIRFWYRNGEVPDDGSAFGALPKEASEEEVGFSQIPAAGDVVSVKSLNAHHEVWGRPRGQFLRRARVDA